MNSESIRGAYLRVLLKSKQDTIYTVPPKPILKLMFDWDKISIKSFFDNLYLTDKYDPKAAATHHFARGVFLAWLQLNADEFKLIKSTIMRIDAKKIRKNWTETFAISNREHMVLGYLSEKHNLSIYSEIENKLPLDQRQIQTYLDQFE